MNEGKSLSELRVAIVGLGLMGGSLALALRGKVGRLYGVDSNPGTRKLALERNVVDEVASKGDSILPEAELVILATPICAILETIEDLPNLHPGSPIVMDIGSTKGEVVEALEKLPPRFDPIGGHPMCGKERLSLSNADASIFQGAAFAFTPLQRTSPQAFKIAEQLALEVGTQPIWLDPTTHDQWTAATSHLPYLVASALSLATPAEAAPLVSSGFRSTTRVAAQKPTMFLDIVKTNKANLINGLGQFRKELDAIEACLEEGDYDKLEDILSSSSKQQRELSDAPR
jgi:prephenate dehydrogenase